MKKVTKTRLTAERVSNEEASKRPSPGFRLCKKRMCKLEMIGSKILEAKMLKKYHLFIFFLFCFVCSNISYAARTSKIDELIISSTVAGNGTAPDYTEPFAGDLNGNTVNVGNIIFNSYRSFVAGAYFIGTGSVERNTVNVSGGIISGIDNSYIDLVGGVVSTGTTKSNMLNVIGGNLSAASFELCGGIVFEGGNSTRNTVNILSGSRICAYVIEGVFQGSGNIYGGVVFKDGTSTGNTVNILSGSRICAYRTVKIYGGSVFSTGNSTGNTVNIFRSSVSVSDLKITIFGGYVSNNGNASNNMVNFSGSDISATYDVWVCGGWVNDTGNATDNVVTISSGSSISANRNVIIIAGAVFGDGNATNNTVTIGENVKLRSNAQIYGGVVSGQGDAKTGNTLNICTDKIFNVTRVDNFEHYNFYLYGKLAEPDTTVLSFAGGRGATKVATSVNLTNTDIKIALSPSSTLNDKGSITIMHCDSGFINFNVPNAIGKFTSFTRNVESTFSFALENNNRDIIATLLTKEVTLRPEAELYPRSMDGLICFINRGFNLFEGIGVWQSSNSYEQRLHAFGAITAEKSKCSIDQNLTITGIVGLAGIGKTFEYLGDTVTCGAFYEFGKGEYKSKNEFDGEKINANGDYGYMGVGLLGKINLGTEHSKLKGMYLDGSVRIGTAKTDYKTNDIKVTATILSNLAQEFRYDFQGLYYGLHVGCMYAYPVLKNLDLEGYGRYMMIHVASKEVDLPYDEKMKIEGIMSNRIRAGVKGKYGINKKINLYLGIAVEQELGGQVKAIIENFPIKDVNLAGTTGIAETGTRIVINERLLIDLGVQGFMGNRGGFAGVLSAVYQFGAKSRNIC
jgi:hypothetical protein